MSSYAFFLLNYCKVFYSNYFLGTDCDDLILCLGQCWAACSAWQKYPDGPQPHQTSAPGAQLNWLELEKPVLGSAGHSRHDSR